MIWGTPIVGKLYISKGMDIDQSQVLGLSNTKPWFVVVFHIRRTGLLIHMYVLSNGFYEFHMILCYLFIPRILKVYFTFPYGKAPTSNPPLGFWLFLSPKTSLLRWYRWTTAEGARDKKSLVTVRLRSLHKNYLIYCIYIYTFIYIYMNNMHKLYNIHWFPCAIAPYFSSAPFFHLLFTQFQKPSSWFFQRLSSEWRSG
jgi:hypothetical protein